MPDYNPKDEFKAPKPFRYGGKAVSAGPIDKKLFEAKHLPTLLANGHIETMTDEEADDYRATRRGAAPKPKVEPGAELTDEQKAKAAQLVADNDKPGLIQKAKEAEIADPEKLGNKPEIAEAIVRAEAAKAA